MGFNIEKSVREALESMTTKVCWATTFCVKYYDFLTQPEKHADEFRVMLDESWFYAGEGVRRMEISKTCFLPMKGETERKPLLLILEVLGRKPTYKVLSACGSVPLLQPWT